MDALYVENLLSRMEKDGEALAAELAKRPKKELLEINSLVGLTSYLSPWTDFLQDHQAVVAVMNKMSLLEKLQRRWRDLKYKIIWTLHNLKEKVKK